VTIDYQDLIKIVIEVLKPPAGYAVLNRDNPSHRKADRITKGIHNLREVGSVEAGLTDGNWDKPHSRQKL